MARTVSTHQGNPVARKAPPIGERHPPPGAIEQAAPLKTDDETARGWLREALSLNDDLSDTDRRTIEAAVALLDLDLGAVAREQAARWRRRLSNKKR